MTIKSTISNAGMYVLGIVIFLAVLALPVLFIVGGVVVAEKALPWLMLLSILALGFCLIILLPLTVFKATRGWAGVGFYFSSFIFGLTGWFMGLLLTWMLWGGFAVVIGLFLCGAGVVPMAMLATLFNGMWMELGVLFLAIVLTFGCRFLGIVLAEGA